MAKKEENEAETKSKTIKMVRKLKEGEEGPTTADVHPDEVGNYQTTGWTKK